MYCNFVFLRPLGPTSKPPGTPNPPPGDNNSPNSSTENPNEEQEENTSDASKNEDNQETDELDFSGLRTYEAISGQIATNLDEIKTLKNLVTQDTETKDRLIRLEHKNNILEALLNKITTDNEKTHDIIDSLPNSGFTPLFSKINFRHTLKLQPFELKDKMQDIYDVLRGSKSVLQKRIYERIMAELDLLSNYLINIIPLGDGTMVIDPSLLRECVDLVATEKPIASMLYHNDYLWAFNTDKHYGYKYKAMWFGGVPQWSLRERTIYSSTFPPELLCDKTLVHHNSVYCLSQHTRASDYSCIKDVEKACNYTYSFSADPHVDLTH